jgi:hypothetical protein
MPFVKQRIVYLKRDKNDFSPGWNAVLVANWDWESFKKAKKLIDAGEKINLKGVIAPCSGYGKTKALALKSLQDQAWIMMKNSHSYKYSCLVAALKG